jgi:triacylglycerol lipase
MSALVEFPLPLYNTNAFVDFVPQSGFRSENALTLMWLAQLAYETGQPATIAAMTTHWGFDSIKPFANSGVFTPAGNSNKRFSFDTRGIIGRKGTMLFIAFAGTDAALWQNVWTDADFLRTGDTDIHEGFQAACAAVESIIDEHVEAHDAEAPLFFAGHSLGAAIAVIAALRADARGRKPTAVYTYGLPRVGGRKFAGRYDERLGERTFRLVHGVDIVPRVPPAAFKFRHVGRMLYCEPGKDFPPPESLAAIGGNKPTLFTGVFAALGDALRRIWRHQWLSPTGPGPLGKFFRLLIPPIREHLQDRYLIALGDHDLETKLRP